MSKITHNFTDGHNKDVKDEIPDWINTMLEKGFEKKEPIIISDLYTANVKTKNCSMCGKILASNEINKCSNCIKL